LITREDEMNIDYGLSVIYNGGKKYTLLMDGIVRDYPIGGLISEYARLHPSQIKDVILNCEHLYDEDTTESLSSFFVSFNRKLHEKYPPVIAIMVTMEFMNTAADWEKSIKIDQEIEFMDMLSESAGSNEIKEFIFQDTPYSQVGRSTVLHKVLSCFLSFSSSFAITKAMFVDVIHANESGKPFSENSVDLFEALFSSYIDFQHIDFRFIALEDGISSMFTIKSSMSLLLFDLAHSINHDVEFNICPNCKEVFVPEGRSDTVYCSYSSPNNPEKTCREIGAQVTRANKEKNDIVTKQYRKVYMRLKMHTRRHPEDKEAIEKYYMLTDEIKEWRIALANGAKTVDQYLEWLNQFED